MGDIPAGFVPVRDPGPFLDLVGPLHARQEADGRLTLGLRIEGRHLNAAGSAQGGLLATLSDFALGKAVRAGAEAGARPVTVSLTTDYLGPAECGDWIEAHTEVEQLGAKLAFGDCSLQVGEREVVRARAVFAVLS